MRERLAEKGLTYVDEARRLTMTQTAIPCTVMRGGTSKGLYFRASDLPGGYGDPRRGAAGRPWARRTRARSTAWAGPTP
jgi:hypothetical protein